MFYLDVLVQWSLRPVWFLACFNVAPVVTFYLACSSSESLFSIIFTLDSPVDLVSLFLQLVELGWELVALIKELSELTEKDSVGEKESTVLVIILKISIFVDPLHQFTVSLLLTN